MGRKVRYFLWSAIDSILGTRSIRPKCISLSLSILEIAKWHEAYEYLLSYWDPEPKIID